MDGAQGCSTSPLIVLKASRYSLVNRLILRSSWTQASEVYLGRQRTLRYSSFDAPGDGGGGIIRA